MMGRNPGKAQIYAVFILHIAPLGKAVAEERIVSGRIEPVESHEREMVGTEIGGCIERGYGTAIASCRLAREGEAMGDVTIADAGIPEGIPLWSKTLVKLAFIGRERQGERGIKGCTSDVPALMSVTDVASHKCIGRYLLFGNLIHRAMQTGLQDGLDAPAVSRKRSIYLAIRKKAGQFQSF